MKALPVCADQLQIFVRLGLARNARNARVGFGACEARVPREPLSWLNEGIYALNHITDP